MKQDYTHEIGITTIIESIKLNIKLVIVVALPILFIIMAIIFFKHSKEIPKYTTQGTLQVNNYNPLTVSELPTVNSSNSSSNNQSNTSDLSTNSETIVSLLATEYILEKIISNNNLDISIAIAKPKSIVKQLEGFFKPKQLITYPDIEQLDVSSDYYNHPLLIKFKSDDQFEVYDVQNDQKRLLSTGRTGEKLYVGDKLSITISSYTGNINNQFIVTKKSMDAVVAELQKKLKINPVIIMKKSNQSDTGLVNISITDINPKQQAKLINDIMEEVRIKSWERQRQNLKQSIEFLENQIKIAKLKLEKSQNELVKLQTKRSIIDLGIQAKVSFDQIASLDAQIMDKNLALQQYSKLYTPKHPLIISLLKQKSALEKKRKVALSVLDSMPKDQAEYETLKNNVEVNKQLYLSLLAKEQDLKIKFYGITSPIEILSYADENVAPIILPLSVKIIAGNLVLILFLEVILVLYFTIWNTGDPKLLPTYLDCHLISIIPYFENPSLGHKEFNIVSSYLLIQFNKAGIKAPMIVNFSSITPKSGKTFITSNISDLLYRTGCSVIQIRFGLTDSFNPIEKYLSLFDSDTPPNIMENAIVNIKIPQKQHLIKNLMEKIAPLFNFIIIESPSISESPLFMNLAHQVQYNIIVSVPQNSTKLAEKVADGFSNLGVTIDKVIYNHPKKPILNSIYSVTSNQF